MLNDVRIRIGSLLIQARMGKTGLGVRGTVQQVTRAEAGCWLARREF